MQAFHNDKKIQKKFLTRIRAHAKADELVKGKYWENGHGCAVGCTIHGSNHADYETELGIPEWLARVEDTFFENLPAEIAKAWPVKFLEAVNIGSDLSKIKAPFMIYILEQSLLNFDQEKFPEVITSIDNVIDLWKKYPEGPSAARSAAWSAAWSAAESAAWSAAWLAAGSAACVKYSEYLLELMKGCK